MTPTKGTPVRVKTPSSSNIRKGVIDGDTYRGPDGQQMVRVRLTAGEQRLAIVVPMDGIEVDFA